MSDKKSSAKGQNFPSIKVDTADLIPYARNSRTHSDEQVNQIVASIKEFGFTNPIIIDEDNGIIAGHGRIMAANKLGMDKVPCVQVSGWSEAQKKAYVIADNKLALNAGWDEEMLALEFEELQDLGFDLEMTGFSLDEIGDIMPDDINEGLTDEDEVPEAPAEPVTIEGDIWMLGEHRLMCGDSTDAGTVALLMDGQKADMVFTDPPYNVGFNGRSGKFDVIKNDNLAENEFEKLIDGMCKTIKALDPSVYYIWCNWNFYGILQGRLDYKSCIVWAKNVFGMGAGYRHQHEFCLFNGKIDQAIKNESDLWSIKKDSKYVHPTQKPVELSVRAFGNHIKLINVVDLFGGSGSTLIGAEQTGRKAFIMELDPKYCDVIIKRWEEYTGKKATMAGDTYEDVAAARGIDVKKAA